MEYITQRLPNGIRLIFKPVISPVSHAGLFFNTGTRDEKKDEHGMAHFVEHTVFKGTQKRNSYHIISRLEDVGGELNAYTTKEETCIHASFLNTDAERAVELIYDIAFNATFPEKEIVKEKEIIIDEINSYKDNPSEQIFDDFEEMIFPNHPLGRNILGTPKSLKKFNRDSILKFRQNNYFTDEIVFCFVGNIENSQLIKLFEKYFTNVVEKLRKGSTMEKPVYTKFFREESKRTFQTHCVIGSMAYNFVNEKRLTLHLLSNILGGPGLNSLLSLSLRDRHGCSYTTESSYTPYSDCGIFEVYFGTDKEHLDKCLKLVYKEFDVLKSQKLGTIKFSKAKKQLIGQMAIASDHNENLMMSIGKSYLVFDKVESLEEINRQIEAITEKQFLDVANEILDSKTLSTLIFK
jgi:predicted Zn-dependent peptidase